MSHETSVYAGKVIHYRDLTGIIVHTAFDVYHALGRGLRERVYAGGLALALAKQGLSIAQEKPFPVMLKGEKVGEIRVDLDVQELVIVECKAAKDGFCPTAKAQALSNIRVCGRPIGLLINFYGPELRVKRFIR